MSPPRPTHYEILSLPQTPSLLPPHLLKKAYRRALLLHHPDKSSPPASATTTTSESARRFTVDEITAAYATLSTPHLRRKYDQQLSERGQGEQGGGGVVGRVLQAVDLDDFSYEEETGRWTRGCRCGETQGFVVTEEDLEEGGGEDVVVGCCGCSLWVNVAYEVVDQEEEEDASRRASSTN